VYARQDEGDHVEPVTAIDSSVDSAFRRPRIAATLERMSPALQTRGWAWRSERGGSLRAA
jgi:hypothetical protein